ncbi:MAG TPA: PAS domain S-box protein, partial [Bryobacteraceae bacterium]|nr:PAS domain S-box protein [Bryobacteraceae bacterium]
GKRPDFVLEFQCQPPQHRWFALRAASTPWGSGVIVAHADITAQKRVDERLSDGQRRFEALVNSIDGIVWELELPAWRFTFVSQQAERILGYPAGQWTDPNFWQDHLYPDDRTWAVDFCTTATDKGENHQLEYRMVAADGRLVWLRDIVTVETTDGRPARRRGVMVDITERRRADEERELLHRQLDQGRARLEMVLRQMPGGVMIAEARTGKLLIANEGLARIWRRDLRDLNEIEDRCRCYKGVSAGGAQYELMERPLVRSILKGEVVKDEECRIERGDGTRGLVSVSSAPIRDSKGNIVAGVAIFSDITQRKDEQAFHQGQKRVLEMIAAAAPLADILTNILQLIELQSNGMLCSILLLGEDGLHVRHGAAPSLPEAYVKAINGAPIGPKAGSCGTAMYRGQPVIVTDILEDPLWEDYRQLAQSFGLRACWSTPILSPAGKVLGSFAMYYHEPRRPSAGETRLTSVATHLAGIAIERERAEQALKRSEEKYRRIVDTAHEGIWLVDDRRTLIFVNQRIAEMIGYSVDELIGRSANDFIASETSEQATQRLERRRGGVAEQFDLRFRRKDGSDLWGIVSTTPVLDEDGQFVGALGMVTDITERKRAEEELRRNTEQIREMAGKLITAQEEERRRIARELHDDIVQKVAVLGMSLSRLKRHLPVQEEPIAGELAGIQQSIFGLAEDVRQLSHRLHPALLEHAGLMAALRSFTTEFSRLESIEVELTVPETSEGIPPGVAVCVYRVVQESLRNIAKHAEAKRAEVSLAVTHDALLLIVKDEGKGFDIDDASRQGLGLVNVKERVHVCQGSLKVTSQRNVGTTLQARIPLSAG